MGQMRFRDEFEVGVGLLSMSLAGFQRGLQMEKWSDHGCE